MAITTDSTKQIDAYISCNPSCKNNRVQSVELAGKIEDLPVYLLPTNLLRFNVRNGRFAAEYAEIKNELGRDLDPNNPKDQNKLREMLLEQDKKATKILTDDLIRVGQRQPGIITHDGFLINGNRRMAIYQNQAQTTGESKWDYIQVSRLPPNANERDIWRIEAGLQLSRQERLDYGPINELLKFREGIATELTPVQIASTLFGGIDAEDIEEGLRRLTLIEDYLKYIGKPGRYKEAEGIHEHFINLRKFIKKEEDKGSDPEETYKFTLLAFDLISRGITHMDLRNLSRIANLQEAKDQLLTEITNNPAIASVIVPVKKAKTEHPDWVVQPSQLNGKDSPTMVAFYNSVDIVEDLEESNKPVKLLTKAKNSLISISKKSLKNNGPEVSGLINELEAIIADLKKSLLD